MSITQKHMSGTILREGNNTEDHVSYDASAYV